MKNFLVTALATPFSDGRINVKDYERLLDFQVENGVDALLAVGTTAEANMLSGEEKTLLFNTAKARAKNIPVCAGVGASGTQFAVEEAKKMRDLGADALLIAPPSFSKCTADGYFQHVYEILCAVGGVPLILYNAPTRAGYALDKNVVANLAELGVRCVKDAGSDLFYTQNVSRYLPVLCGCDELLSESLKAGSCGVISVVSNVAPKLTRSALSGKNVSLFTELAKLATEEINPIAIKYMLYKKGIFSSCEMRLPLTSANVQTRLKTDRLWRDKEWI